MKTTVPRLAATLALLAATFATTACGGASRAATSTGLGSTVTRAPRSPAEIAAADSGRPPFTKADVDFVSGMIGHHAQAVLMAGWAQSHGASPSVRALCERIVVAQRDEIKFMQRWLGERNLPVPDGDTSHMMMAGMDMKLVPGMLTPEQLTELDKARGADWDRLFLKDMIQHHNGAIEMVETLFASQGAVQDEDIFKFASDVHVDQITEVNRMTLMLQSMGSR
jgi:uncharacterized protein (DUF305 family)